MTCYLLVKWVHILSSISSVVVWPRVAGVHWCAGDFLFDGGEAGDLNAEHPLLLKGSG